jgi:malate dehydrogenase (oxaloacetate-decarboxylating)(NADP+)
MNIPVFHDDQHGTAIVCAAAVRNALLVQGKTLKDVKLVTSGAGAAALACVDLLVSMGLPVENVTLTDIKGVVHAGREPDMLDNMARYARHTDARARSPKCWPAPTSSWACRRPACSRPSGCRCWPPIR